MKGRLANRGPLPPGRWATTLSGAGRENESGNMKETKTASGTPEARAAMHEMMAAFEAFKGANDARLEEIERKSAADGLLEEKVARIDAAVAGPQARLDRMVSEVRRPELAPPSRPSAEPPPRRSGRRTVRSTAI